jgi:hypothetical protein
MVFAGPRRASLCSHPHFFLSLLQKDFLYITVQQNNYGIDHIQELEKDFPSNLLIISTTTIIHAEAIYIKNLSENQEKGMENP